MNIWYSVSITLSIHVRTNTHHLTNTGSEQGRHRLVKAVVDARWSKGLEGGIMCLSTWYGWANPFNCLSGAVTLNRREIVCIHAEKDNKRWRHPCACKSKTKKTISIKPSIKIKFKFHLYFFYNKIFKTRPHLSIFRWLFSKKIIITNINFGSSEQII